MLLCRFDKAIDHRHGLIVFAGEFLVFLIAPGGGEVDHLTLQHRHAILQLIDELLEAMGEAPEFLRVDNRLRHNIGSLNSKYRYVLVYPDKVRL